MPTIKPIATLTRKRLLAASLSVNLLILPMLSSESKNSADYGLCRYSFV